MGNGIALTCQVGWGRKALLAYERHYSPTSGHFWQLPIPGLTARRPTPNRQPRLGYMRTRSPARSILLASLVLGAFISPLHAQDAEPENATPEVGVNAPVKPRTKSKPPHPKAAQKTPVPHTAASTQTAIGPSGATTVSESYGDWTMTCVRPAEKVACAVVQSQGNAKTGQRQFGIELKAPHDGHADGTVIMPFGLAIEPGITFKLDDQTLGKGAPYTSCTGEGCLVAISFPTLATDAMRNAKVLTVTGTKATGSAGSSTGSPAAVTVPLAGFAQALDRAVALGG